MVNGISRNISEIILREFTLPHPHPNFNCKHVKCMYRTFITFLDSSAILAGKNVFGSAFGPLILINRH